MADPVAADLAQEAMCDGVPFGATTGVVANGDIQVGVMGEVLQLALPQSWPMPIAAARVGFDQQVASLGIARLAQLFPPAANRGDGELRRRGVGADVNQRLVSLCIVDPIRGGSTFGVAGKVIGVDDIGAAAIPRAGMCEPTAQLGLLGVHANRWLAVAVKLSRETLDQAGLLVALRMRPADQTLDVGRERIAQRLEQAPDGGGIAGIPGDSGLASQALSMPLLRGASDDASNAVVVSPSRIGDERFRAAHAAGMAEQHARRC